MLPTLPTFRRIDAEGLDALVRELPQRPLAADPDEGIRLSLAGAQPKLPVVIDAQGIALPTNAAGPTTHILKPEPAAFPDLVDNEAFCMALAAECGLRTAAVERATTLSGLRYLIVERYDRDLMADPIRRLHQEDFCQALGYASERKYQPDGGPGIGDAVGLLRSAVAAPVVDLPRFWEALVLNWLVGNCDAHGKNFSLLYDGRSATLAPLYDLVSTCSYPSLTQRVAMTIGGARNLDEIDVDAWTSQAEQVRVRASFARETVRRVASKAGPAAERIAAEHATPAADRIAARVTALAARHGD